jgi:beta-xylosidase
LPALREEFFDGFTSPQLDASWRWPMSGEQTMRVETASGHLVLTPGAAAGADKLAGAVLAQRASSGDYVATTVVDARGLTAGAHAGLAVYGWREEAIGVSVGGGNVFVWRREGKEQVTPATTPLPNAPTVYLRMTAAGGEQFRFAFSTNGRDWRELGGIVLGSYIEGAHVALTAGGEGAAARFDWVKIKRARPAAKSN